MNKINGYTEDEARSFVQYIYAGRRAGSTLTSLFEGYARQSGRAKGSVRNYYYALLRSTGDEKVRALLRGTGLKAEPIHAFSDEETDRLLRAILTEKSKGISVRRAVLNLAGGDDRLMLRYQNKYRNVLAKQPERIEKLMEECGGAAPCAEWRRRLTVFTTVWHPTCARKTCACAKRSSSSPMKTPPLKFK